MFQKNIDDADKIEDPNINFPEFQSNPALPANIAIDINTYA